MGSAEGGSDPTAVNKQGYAGQFQFGAGRLADLGLYTPALVRTSSPTSGAASSASRRILRSRFATGLPEQPRRATCRVHGPCREHRQRDQQHSGRRQVRPERIARGGPSGRRPARDAGVHPIRRQPQQCRGSNGTTLQQVFTAEFAAGGPALLQKTLPALQCTVPAALQSNLPGRRPARRGMSRRPGVRIRERASWSRRPPRRRHRSTLQSPGQGWRVRHQPRRPRRDFAAGLRTPTASRCRRAVHGCPIPARRRFQTSAADAPVPVAPSPIALRTGGTDVAGRGAGPDALPAVPAPNRMYQTGLPGITIGANPLAPSPVTGAPPGTATAAAAPAPGTAPPAGTAPPGGAARPPVLTPPPALPRAIPPPQVLPSGLTAADTRIVAGMVQSGTPTATVATFIESAKQRNTALQQQYLTNSAAQQQADVARQQWVYEQQVKAGWEDAGNGVIRNRYTGETKYAGPPTPRIGKDESGRQFEVLPGGGCDI